MTIESNFARKVTNILKNNFLLNKSSDLESFINLLILKDKKNYDGELDIEGKILIIRKNILMISIYINMIITKIIVVILIVQVMKIMKSILKITLVKIMMLLIIILFKTIFQIILTFIIILKKKILMKLLMIQLMKLLIKN